MLVWALEGVGVVYFLFIYRNIELSCAWKEKPAWRSNQQATVSEGWLAATGVVGVRFRCHDGNGLGAKRMLYIQST